MAKKEPPCNQPAEYINYPLADSVIPNYDMQQIIAIMCSQNYISKLSERIERYQAETKQMREEIECHEEDWRIVHAVLNQIRNIVHENKYKDLSSADSAKELRFKIKKIIDWGLLQCAAKNAFHAQSAIPVFSGLIQLLYVTSPFWDDQNPREPGSKLTSNGMDRLL